MLIHASKVFEKGEKQDQFMNSWAELVSSPDHDTYQCRWDTFDDTYGFNYPELILYLKDTWLELKKVLFIRAWID